MKTVKTAAIISLTSIFLLAISACSKQTAPIDAISSSSSLPVQPTIDQNQAFFRMSPTQGITKTALSKSPTAQEVAVATVTVFPSAQVSTATAMPEPCSPTTQGPFANINPRGQILTWWHQQSGTNGDALAVLVSEFNTSNDCCITVNAEYQGSYNDIRDKMKAAIETGTLPGLVVGYQNDEAAYAQAGALIDLNPYLSDEYWGLSAADLSDFNPIFLDQGVNPAYGNMRLGFPPNRSAEVIFYNMSWLKELGFNTPPTSPEEFRAMACAAAASRSDGTGGYILRSDASAIASWTYAFGGAVISSDGLRYVYDGQATADAMTFLKGMYEEGCAYQTDQYPDTALAARQAIFTQGSTSTISYYSHNIAEAATQNNRPTDEWGIIAIPHTTANAYTNIYGGDVMIPATTPETQLAAWIFIKWFTQPNVMARWDEASGYFPTRYSAEEFMTGYIGSNDQYRQGVSLLQYNKYEPQLDSYQQVRILVSRAFNEIMSGAEISSTLNKLTQQANALQAEQ
jgi:multiple sugar transport system substrate-binding protein